MQTDRSGDGKIMEELQWYYAERSKRCVEALRKRRIDAHYVANRDEARAKALSLIPSRASVGFGDSLTSEQIGLTGALENDNQRLVFNPFFQREQRPLRENWNQVVGTMRRALTADVFVTGINAVTLDGRLVCTDGLGNRVAGLTFGPKQVIVIAGVNKIVKNLDEAFEHIKQVSAPKVMKWHFLKHHWKEERLPPCGLTGMCPSGDCHSPFRVCNVTVIIEGEPALYRDLEGQVRLSVVIVGEELGL